MGQEPNERCVIGTELRGTRISQSQAAGYEATGRKLGILITESIRSGGLQPVGGQLTVGLYRIDFLD